MRLVLGWLILTVAVMVTVALLPGMDVDWSPGTYLTIAAVFAILNVTLGLILRFVTLPLLLLTRGLFSLVLNAVLLLVTDWLVDSLDVESFWAALAGAAVISLVAAVIEGIARSLQRDLAPSP
jgi:putative membrane protein